MSDKHQRSREAKQNTAAIPNWVVWVTLLIVISFVAFVRIRLINAALERDEGEYAYAGQLMLQGIPPYKLAYNMKLPGTYAAYAVIMAFFGQTIAGIHLGLLLVNATTIALVYLLGRRLFGTIAGLVAAATFALLSLSPSVLGLAAHATHFVTLFGVLGTLLLLCALEMESKKLLFWSGLCFGLAFVMKQQAIFLDIFGIAAVAWRELKRRPVVVSKLSVSLVLFSSGAFLPFASICLALFAAGVFPKFWFWTFSYARQYVGIVSVETGLGNLWRTALPIFVFAPGLWILAAVGAVFLVRGGLTRQQRLLPIGFLLATIAVTFPGLYFRPHYFIPALAAAAILTGLAAKLLVDQLDRFDLNFSLRAGLLALFACAFVQPVVSNWRLFFRLSPEQAIIKIYNEEPFPESLKIARYIRENSSPSSRVAVLGSEPQVYFYSRRHSATGYIYVYGLTEQHPYALAMQNEMISEIEANNPEFIVMWNTVGSWMAPPDSNHLIFDWFEHYGPQHYRPVGLVDVQSERTIYKWDKESIGAVPRSKSYIWLFKRIDLP